MNNGQPKPHSIKDQKLVERYILILLIRYSSNIPAQNISNNFATLDYDAHINTKIDFTKNHVFKSMTVDQSNLINIQARIRPFNYQKRHTQVISTISNFSGL